MFGYDNAEINTILGETKEEFADRTMLAFAVLERLGKAFPDICFLHPAPYLLNNVGSGYDVVKEDYCFYYDDNHLSREGVLLEKNLFESVFSD